MKNKYEILLIFVIAIRATSFIFNKLALQSMTTFNLLAIRFLLAFIILFCIFFKRIIKFNKKTIVAGVIVGTFSFLMMIAECEALKYANSSSVSLIEHTSIILVPVIEAALIMTMPKRMDIIASVFAFAGVALLNIQIGGMSKGMILALVAALMYALSIIATDRLTKGEADSFGIGIIQNGVIGFMSLVFSVITEGFVIPTQGNVWLMILMLAVVCSGLGYTLQPVAQAHVSATKTGLYGAINPMVATLLGVVVLKEKLSLVSIFGIVLILSGLVIHNLDTSKESDESSVVSE